jgi:hypothetical protein
MFDPPPNWHEGLPPGPAEERLQREEIEVWPDISEAERIGWGWSLLVSDREEGIEDRARAVPGFRWSEVGILDPSVDPRLEVDDPRFGVVLYAEDLMAEGGERLDGLVMDGIELPVLVRNVRFEAQRAVPSRSGPGRLACWATSRNGAREGWLTALHVANHSAFAGSVVDRGRACIDVALVDVGRTGSGATRRSVPPTGGSAVELDLGTPTPATVIGVATNLGITRSSHFPLRFTLSVAGSPGDSGGLILADPCGEPMGIYLGANELRNGARGGVGQALTQLEYLMNLEAYL